MALRFARVALCCAVCAGCAWGGPKTYTPYSGAAVSRTAKAEPNEVQTVSHDVDRFGEVRQNAARQGVLLPKNPEDLRDRKTLADRLAPTEMGTKIKKSWNKLWGMTPNERTARDIYAKAEELFSRKEYKDAANAFASAARRWPDSFLEEDAIFMQAESYFFADRYDDASGTYQVLLKKYTSTKHLDVVSQRLFAIGQYWDELSRGKSLVQRLTPNFFDRKRPIFDTFGNAQKCYQSVRINDPLGPLSDDALMATANSYFVAGQFEDAAVYYDDLQKSYSQSEHQPQAHLLAIAANLRAYQGASYDDTPLKNAEELLNQTLSQFGEQMATERERLLATRAAIREERAQREWNTAAFYRKKKQVRAARYHYQTIIKDFPETRLAQEANQQLIETKDLPPEPKNHFKWLADVLPKRKTRY